MKVSRDEWGFRRITHYSTFIFTTTLFLIISALPLSVHAGNTQTSQGDDEATFEAAENDWKAHKWEDALNKYDKVAQGQSAHASRAHIMIGRYFKYHGHWDEALAHFESAIEKSVIKRDEEDAVTSIGAVYIAKGEYDKALPVFRDLISKTTDWQQVKYCSYWISKLRGVTPGTEGGL